MTPGRVVVRGRQSVLFGCSLVHLVFHAHHFLVEPDANISALFFNAAFDSLTSSTFFLSQVASSLIGELVKLVVTGEADR